MPLTDGRHPRNFPRILLAVLLVAAAFYLADYLSVRLPGGNPLGRVQLNRYYAVPHKGGKTEFTFAGSQTGTCVHSLLPHLGYAPCWYLERHAYQQIDM